MSDAKGDAKAKSDSKAKSDVKSDAKSARGAESWHTRSVAGASTASSTLSQARRRAALSRLQAEQAQRKAAAEAELARRQAEAQAEAARQQAEAARRQAEEQAETARLKAQDVTDEADLRELEAKLIEEDENGRLSVDNRSSRARPPAEVPCEPPGQLRELPPMQVAARTRDWVNQWRQPPMLTGETPPNDHHLQTGRPPGSQRQQLTPHLPRITLEKFSGSALEWPRWIALFRALVHERDDLTDVERLTYLQSHLTGPAKEAVRGMLCDASLYGAAMRELEREFGDPARVIHATMRRLLAARPVRDGELSALTELSRDLHTAVNVLQCLRYDADLGAATNVTAVVGKLPSALVWKWGEFTIDNGITRPTLIDLDSWLRRCVAAGRVTLTVTGNKPSPKVEVNSADGRPRRVYATALAPPGRREAIKPSASTTMVAIKTTTPASSGACVVCEREHNVHTCDEFRALTVEERAELAGRAGLCFNCLARGHVSAKCPSTSRCEHEHCGRRHHTLLHNSGRVFPWHRNDDGTETAVQHIGIASVAAERRGQVALQTLPVTVYGPAGSYTTNALLDLGSQVTLVTDDLCNRLGISGPSDGLVLGTLNGRQRLQSRSVCLSVESVCSGGEVHDIRDAQTIPTLDVLHRSTDWSAEKRNWPHLADLELPGVTAGGTVDLLLGADNLDLILPREVVRGPPGAPGAVRTMLGWTATGRLGRADADGTDKGQVRSSAASSRYERTQTAATCAVISAASDRPPTGERKATHHRRRRWPTPPTANDVTIGRRPPGHQLRRAQPGRLPDHAGLHRITPRHRHRPPGTVSVPTCAPQDRRPWEPPRHRCRPHAGRPASRVPSGRAEWSPNWTVRRQDCVPGGTLRPVTNSIWVRPRTGEETGPGPGRFRTRVWRQRVTGRLPPVTTPVTQ